MILGGGGGRGHKTQPVTEGEDFQVEEKEQAHNRIYIFKRVVKAVYGTAPLAGETRIALNTRFVDFAFPGNRGW